VATPTDEFPLRARVTVEGVVVIEPPSERELPAPALPAGAEQKAKLLLRAAWKHADADGAPPPRRIVRWRA
jgi:hypothetical protein